MNPLLSLSADLPDFAAIDSTQVEPAIRELIAGVERGLDAFEVAPQATWAGTLGRIHTLVEPLRLAWGVVGHLMAVRNEPSLRAAHAAMQGEVVKTWVRLGQSRALFTALNAIRDGAEWARLDSTQQRILSSEIRDMQLAGVGLNGAEKERYQAISLELSELGTRFSNQLLDAGKAWHLDLTTLDEVAGLPATLLAQTAAMYQAAGLTSRNEQKAPSAGPWRLTLDVPIYGPFMEHSQRRDLREKLYRAFITRAAAAPHDNLPVLERILALRQELARLLGKTNHAEVSLATKMAGTLPAVDQLLNQLRTAAKPKAAEELAELTAFARQRSGDPGLQLALWDMAFWAERLREDRYAYTDEALRPYFALPQVLSGLFALARRLFDVVITPVTDLSIWDPAVQVFRVADPDGRERALFYLDAYSRPANKRGGAWMDSFRDRLVRGGGSVSGDSSVRSPVAYLVCNQTPPIGDTPSLMTFREVETLFHEFGHGLQHLLTTVDHPQAAGINGVEWDAIELPSQFMENWCYDEATILGDAQHPGLARHWQTGAPLPRELFARVCAARTFRAASMTLRQVNLATLDLELHARMTAGESPLAVQQRISAVNSVLAPLPEDRFLCSFSHIFAGGYAAGYYSYKWAEVLSADAFAAFTEAGPDAHPALGRRFRDSVLASGGARHPLAVFRDFRGREPQVDALLVQTGLRTTIDKP